MERKCPHKQAYVLPLMDTSAFLALQGLHMGLEANFKRVCISLYLAAVTNT